MIISEQSGTIEEVSAHQIVVASGNERTVHKLDKFRRSNQSTCINQRPLVREGQKVKKGDSLADGLLDGSGRARARRERYSWRS